MSLPDSYIPEFKRILQSISINLPGYVTRDPQKRMMAAIAEVLSRAVKHPDDGTEPPAKTGDTIICVEGKTGTGKSLAYLVGGSIAARDKGFKLVVSSATVALQEQLVYRDVPFFLENAGVKLTCVMAKGRGRYVCHAKLIRATGGGDDLFTDNPADADAIESPVGKIELRTANSLLKKYEDGSWSGDRDVLESPLPDAVWSQITTDRHSCLNRKCPQFNSCAQMKARDGIKTADIVIANHDLLLADMSLGGGVILPDPAETFYVLDEGHHIAQKAVDTFSMQHYIDAGYSMMMKLSKSGNSLGMTFHELSPLAMSISDTADGLAESLNEAYGVFHQVCAIEHGSIWRFPKNRLPVQASEMAANIINYSKGLLSDLKKAREQLRDLAGDDPSVAAQKLMADLGFFNGRVEAIFDTWTMIVVPPEQSPVPIAKWISTHAKGKKIDYVVHASPVVAGTRLSEMFFAKAAGVVVTSATLKTMGNFKQLLNETGLSHFPDVSTMDLPSPFNHTKQGVLSVPNIKASAKDPVAHTAAIAVELPKLIKANGNTGMLVLFSSGKQMRDVAAALPESIRSELLIQGEIPKEQILYKHQSRIESGKCSVIFGLQSFAEGVDLRGDLCTHVVIAKIPFAVPNDPVQETLSEWLESQNLSYFNEVAVPQACLRMIQAAGRLIRTETDTGTLTVLDDRLTSKQYGRQIIASLPPFRRIQ